MRYVTMTIAATALASCSAVPPPPSRSPEQQATYTRLVGDKVPKTPISCLPSWNANDMSIIDGRTVAFRVGTGTVNIVTLTDGCSQLGYGNYALKTNSYGGMGLCTGDIAQVYDPLNRINVGSCTIQSIVPYTRP